MLADFTGWVKGTSHKESFCNWSILLLTFVNGSTKTLKKHKKVALTHTRHTGGHCKIETGRISENQAKTNTDCLWQKNRLFGTDTDCLWQTHTVCDSHIHSPRDNDYLLQTTTVSDGHRLSVTETDCLWQTQMQLQFFGQIVGNKLRFPGN